MKRLIKLGLLIAALAWCVPARAQVTAGTSYINSNSVSQTSGSVVMSGGVDPNSCTIVAVVTDDNGTANTIAAPTATGLTFAQISTILRTVNDFNVALFRAWTTSALGSTTISGSWNQSNDWLMLATDFTGTAGTAGNNCSDAIGGTNTTTGTSTSPTVTVTSTSHNNSKYFAVIVFGNSATRTITKGASYTNGSASTWDGTWAGAFSEYSTSPVTPAANTAVNGTISSAVTQEGLFAIEILVSTGGGSSTAGFDKRRRYEQADE